jgi:hypothetical protein
VADQQDSPRARAEAAGDEDEYWRRVAQQNAENNTAARQSTFSLFVKVSKERDEARAALTASRQRADTAEQEGFHLSAQVDAARMELALMQERLATAERELSHIDAVLARRPALDKPTRAANIEHAIATAARADAAERALAKAERERDQERAARGEAETARERLAHRASLAVAFIRDTYERRRDGWWRIQEDKELLALLLAPCPPNAGATPRGEGEG